MSSYTTRPTTRNVATAWMLTHHRHLRRPVTGWLFGVEILDRAGELVGVAMAARPSARMLQDGATVEVTRLAVLPGHQNACSYAYGRLRRAAWALGYRRAYTYTREDEDGTSLRAAGWICEGPAGGGEADRPGRHRHPSEDPSRKVRWVSSPGSRKTA